MLVVGCRAVRNGKRVSCRTITGRSSSPEPRCLLFDAELEIPATPAAVLARSFSSLPDEQASVRTTGRGGEACVWGTRSCSAALGERAAIDWLLCGELTLRVCRRRPPRRYADPPHVLADATATARSVRRRSSTEPRQSLLRNVYCCLLSHFPKRDRAHLVFRVAG